MSKSEQKDGIVNSFCSFSRAFLDQAQNRPAAMNGVSTPPRRESETPTATGSKPTTGARRATSAGAPSAPSAQAASGARVAALESPQFVTGVDVGEGLRLVVEGDFRHLERCVPADHPALAARQVGGKLR